MEMQQPMSLRPVRSTTESIVRVTTVFEPERVISSGVADVASAIPDAANPFPTDDSIIRLYGESVVSDGRLKVYVSVLDDADDGSTQARELNFKLLGYEPANLHGDRMVIISGYSDDGNQSEVRIAYFKGTLFGVVLIENKVVVRRT